MKLLLLISLGGAVGTALRYLTCLLINLLNMKFIATLLVNILGSFLIAYLLADNFDTKIPISEFKSIFSVGLLGGFTTFSAFSYETLYIANHYSYKHAGAYIFIMIFLSLCAAAFGLYLNTLNT